MRIAAVIQENRRKKGLTQEQLAEMVGVSAPAVSKWESAGSCPDITLLAPIARALGVTVDTLVGFTADLSDEEAETLAAECHEIFSREGAQAGCARCEALLCEYPNSNALKMQIAGVYQRLALTRPGCAEANLGRVYELYQQIYDSGDARLHDAAVVILAGKALAEDDTARAEALLAELPKVEYSPDSLYPLLYLKKGEHGKAVELLETQAVKYGNQLTTALCTLSSVAAQDGEPARALACCRAGSCVAETLGLQGVNAFLQSLNLLVKYGTREDAVHAAVRYLDSIRTLDRDFRCHPFLSHVRIRAQQPGQTAAIQRTLLKGFLDEGAFAPLFDEEPVQQALARLRAAIPAEG